MSKRTSAIVLAAVALVLVFVTLVVAAGLWIGVTWMRGHGIAGAANGFWNEDGRSYGLGSYAGPGMMRPGLAEGMWSNRGYDGPGMMRGSWDWEDMHCTEGYAGPGMMWGDWEAMPCDQGDVAPDGESVLSLEDAEAAVERYVERLGYDDLHVAEVMEFERNFYAIVAEEDTGIGAMELLIDKGSGNVGLEPGPNMMWNAEYGMHRSGRMGMGMMGGITTGEMTVSPEEAEEIAQRWLDANLRGRTAGEADPFYGYYTLHFLKDGEIEGMLSVHGSTGDVWYHSWHGDFITMSGEHD